MPMYPKLSMGNTLILEVMSIDLKMVTIHTLKLTMRSVEGQAVGGKCTHVFAFKGILNVQ